MKFDGKQLFELGVPKNKIKFYIGVEFESAQSVLDSLKVSNTMEIAEKKKTWVEWIWNNIPHLTMMIKGDSKTGIPIIFPNCIIF